MKLTSFIGLFFIIVISIGSYREYDREKPSPKNIKQDSLLKIIIKQKEYIDSIELNSLNIVIKEQNQQIEKLKLQIKSDSINQKSKVKMNTDTTIITATFKGQNGSLGYKTGKEYTLKFTHLKKNPTNKLNGSIIIEDLSRTDGVGDCEYESINAFLKNWKKLESISEEEAKRYNKENVLNFTDFCKGKSTEEIQKALVFYNEPFALEKVMTYFKNWSLTKKPNLIKAILKHRTEKFSTNITIHDEAEYAFWKGNEEDDINHLNWQYVPKTMSEFISDCLRFEDIDLIFSATAIKKIYG